MMKELIVRAWKDPGFRAELSPQQREHLPEHPSGQSVTELEEAELREILGGNGPSVPTPTHDQNGACNKGRKLE